MTAVDDCFTKMKSNLEITRTEQAQASQRHNAIREVLRKAFDLKSDFLTGSYKRDTKTKRLKDVDIFIVFDEDGDDSDKRQLHPLGMLQAVQSALEIEYDDVAVNMRSCTVHFGREDDVTSFDVVPAFEHADGGYEIPDRAANSWTRTDPSVHATSATEKNKECDGRWKPLVKMIKGWNRHVDKPVRPSFLLEVMALEIVTSPMARYQDELRWFFATAADRIGDPWPDPAGLGPDVNALMTASQKLEAKRALEDAVLVAERAIRLEDAGKFRDAVGAWRELFGNRIPWP